MLLMMLKMMLLLDMLLHHRHGWQKVGAGDGNESGRRLQVAGMITGESGRRSQSGRHSGRRLKQWLHAGRTGDWHAGCAAAGSLLLQSLQVLLIH